MAPEEDVVAKCLALLESGDDSAIATLLPHIYSDLRQMARRMYRGNPAQHSLHPTALVHEAYMRLAGGSARRYESRGHFMKVAAIAMRQLLTDHARNRRAQKRGGVNDKETLHSAVAIQSSSGEMINIIDLDDALTELAEHYPRQARVVELRFLAGLSVEETAEALEMSSRTAKSDWQMARTWLSRALNSDQAGGDEVIAE